MKEKLIKIYNNYKLNFIKYWKITKKYLKDKYIKIKDYLLCYENRRKNLTMIAASIVFNLFLLIYSSNAFYYNEFGLSILNALIGDFDSEKYDYVLRIYLENADNKGTYHISNSIPLIGYTYNKHTCKNGSELIYDDKNKTTNVTISEKESCSIYFDVDVSPDIIININIEESIDSNTYKIVDNFPYIGYTYNNYNCNNNSELIIDNDLHKITAKANQKDICNVYFKKNNNDINVNLFIEDGLNTYNYYANNFMPSNYKFELNSEKSVCKDSNENNLEKEIAYVNGVISVEKEDINYCDIYMDVANE